MLPEISPNLHKDYRWENPYIEKSLALREYIPVNRSTNPLEEEILAVQELLKKSSWIAVELGSGSGKHLVELGKRHPEGLALGFELRFKRAVRTIEKALKAEVSNCYVLRTNARFITNIFPSQSIDTLFMNFPDPWAKRGWEKHRMAQANQLVNFHTILKPGGSFKFKTDHREYFNAVESILLQRADLFTLTYVTRDLHTSSAVDQNISTEFEQLFLSQGLPICYLCAQRMS